MRLVGDPEVQSASRRELLAYVIGGTTALAGCTSSENDESSPKATKGTNRTSSPSPADGDDQTSDVGQTSTAPERVVVSVQGDSYRATAVRTDNVLFQSENPQAVLQQALDVTVDGGEVLLRDGTYTIPHPDLVIPSHVRLEGAGTERSILKMAAGLNGTAKPLVRFTKTTEGAELANLGIDGNESSNRSIALFPDSPPGHGLIVNGENNVVENVAVHDTIRSNVVVAGSDHHLRSLELANAATDHWLYVTGAERCTIQGVTATGFARAGGIVFGTNGRTCRRNTLTDVDITASRPTPYYEGDPETRERFPNHALVLRGVGDAASNTVENLTVRDPQHPEGYGQQITIVQPDATLRNVQYTGPAGFWSRLVTVGTGRGGAAGTTIQDISVRVTQAFDREHRTRAILASHASDVTVDTLDVRGATGVGLQGLLFDGEFRPVAANVLRDATIETSGSVIVADGSKHPVTELALVDVTDIGNTGITERGEVTYKTRDID